MPAPAPALAKPKTGKPAPDPAPQAPAFLGGAAAGGTPLYLQRMPQDPFPEDGETEDGPLIQAKLIVNRPGDRFEAEADSIADRVVRGPGPRPAPVTPAAPATGGSGHIQRACAKCGGSGAPCASCGGGQATTTPRHIQRSCAKCAGGAPCPDCAQEPDLGHGDPIAQRKPDPAPAKPRPVHTAAEAVARPGPGSPLGPDLRARVEPELGADLSGVRVHTGPRAAQAAQSIGARAFTHGQHIWLGAGQSPSDTHLMAHELTHTQQQARGATGPQLLQRAPADHLHAEDGSAPAGRMDGAISDELGDVDPPDPGEPKPEFDQAEKSAKASGLKGEAKPDTDRPAAEAPKVETAASVVQAEATTPGEPIAGGDAGAPPAAAAAPPPPADPGPVAAAVAAAAALETPAAPAPLELPKVVTPVNGDGEPLLPDVGAETDVQVLAGRLQAMREGAHQMRLKARAERANAAVMRGNIALVDGHVAEAEGGLVEAQSQVDFRRGVADQAETALATSEEKADKVAAEAPDFGASAEAASAESGPMASEAADVSAESAANVPDDEEAAESSSEQAGQSASVAADSASMDQAVNATGTRADDLAADAAKAKAKNAQSQTKIDDTRAGADQTEARITEMDGQTGTARGQLEAQRARPDAIEAEALRLDGEAEALIANSDAMAAELGQVQTSFAADIATVPGSETLAKQNEGAIQRAPDPAAERKYAPKGYEGRKKIDLKSKLFGEEKLTEEQQAKQAEEQAKAEQKRRDRIKALEAKCDGDFSKLSAADKAGLALGMMTDDLFGSVSGIHWPDFSAAGLGKALISAFDPRGPLEGVLGGLSKIASGGLNLFDADQWARDPLGNLLKSAADIATGITTVLGSIVALAGVVMAIMAALIVVTLGWASPVAVPVISFCGSVMTTVGGWTISVGLVALELQAMLFIKNLVDAMTAQTAEELVIESEQMTADTKQAAEIGMQIGQAAMAKMGGAKVKADAAAISAAKQTSGDAFKQAAYGFAKEEIKTNVKEAGKQAVAESFGEDAAMLYGAAQLVHGMAQSHGGGDAPSAKGETEAAAPKAEAAPEAAPKPTAEAGAVKPEAPAAGRAVPDAAPAVEAPSPTPAEAAPKPAAAAAPEPKGLPEAKAPEAPQPKSPAEAATKADSDAAATPPPQAGAAPELPPAPPPPADAALHGPAVEAAGKPAKAEAPDTKAKSEAATPKPADAAATKPVEPGAAPAEAGATKPADSAEAKPADAASPTKAAAEAEARATAAPKDGADLTHAELQAELAAAQNQDRHPVTDPELKKQGYVEEIKLDNGHEWRKREDGTWCRFSSGTNSVCGLSLTPDQMKRGVDANNPDAVIDDLVTNGPGDRRPHPDDVAAAQERLNQGKATVADERVILAEAVADARQALQANGRDLSACQLAGGCGTARAHGAMSVSAQTAGGQGPTRIDQLHPRQLYDAPAPLAPGAEPAMIHIPGGEVRPDLTDGGAGLSSHVFAVVTFPSGNKYIFDPTVGQFVPATGSLPQGAGRNPLRDSPGVAVELIGEGFTPLTPESAQAHAKTMNASAADQAAALPRMQEPGIRADITDRAGLDAAGQPAIDSAVNRDKRHVDADIAREDIDAAGPGLIDRGLATPESVDRHSERLADYDERAKISAEADPKEAKLDAVRAEPVSQERIDAELAEAQTAPKSPVTDPTLKANGYTDEVKLANGETWRKHKDGAWCRFSATLGGLCIPSTGAKPDPAAKPVRVDDTVEGAAAAKQAKGETPPLAPAPDAPLPAEAPTTKPAEAALPEGAAKPGSAEAAAAPKPGEAGGEGVDAPQPGPRVSTADDPVLAKQLADGKLKVAKDKDGTVPEVSMPAHLRKADNDANWSLQDKIERWNEYVKSKPKKDRWSYERWSNNYDARALTAQQAGQAARDYAQQRRQRMADEGRTVVGGGEEVVIDLAGPKPDGSDPVKMKEWQEQADATRKEVLREFRKMERGTRRDENYERTPLEELPDPLQRRADLVLVESMAPAPAADVATPTKPGDGASPEAAPTESFKRPSAPGTTTTLTTVVEYKSGDAYRTDSHLFEAARDIVLARRGYNVEWVVRGVMPKDFEAHLRANGIKVVYVDEKGSERPKSP